MSKVHYAVSLSVLDAPFPLLACVCACASVCVCVCVSAHATNAHSMMSVVCLRLWTSIALDEGYACTLLAL
jgi:hypothetical protein